MKKTIVILIIMLVVTTVAFAKSPPQGSGGQKTNRSSQKVMPYVSKGAVAKNASFRVARVEFREVPMNNTKHLAAGIVFNQSIDSNTVQENSNIRLLWRDENGFWVDASTQGNRVQVNPIFIRWISGAPVKNGYYKMYLRGTIKSGKGEYLDCDNDGRGEAGNLPAYESQVYKVDNTELIPNEDEETAHERIKSLL